MRGRSAECYSQLQVLVVIENIHVPKEGTAGSSPQPCDIGVLLCINPVACRTELEKPVALGLMMLMNGGTACKKELPALTSSGDQG